MSLSSHIKHLVYKEFDIRMDIIHKSYHPNKVMSRYPFGYQRGVVWDITAGLETFEKTMI